MASTLILLRHAKSDYPPGVVDHDRPLNARGRRDAPVAGALITALLPEVEVALVSTAARAQQTWQLSGVRAGTVIDCPELYLAAPDLMLRRVRQEQASSVIVVSHNPGTEDLAARLTADTGSAAYRRMLTKFPTAAFALLRAEAPFAQWDYGQAQLVAFEVGRGSS